MHVARSSDRLATSQRWLAEVVRSSNVAFYELRMAGCIWQGAKRCLIISKELRMVYKKLRYGWWVVTSQNGWTGVVRSLDKAGNELRMAICRYKVAHI
jgi:hypothetical protein